MPTQATLSGEVTGARSWILVLSKSRWESKLGNGMSSKVLLFSPAVPELSPSVIFQFIRTIDCVYDRKYLDSAAASITPWMPCLVRAWTKCWQLGKAWLRSTRLPFSLWMPTRIVSLSSSDCRNWTNRISFSLWKLSVSPANRKI